MRPNSFTKLLGIEVPVLQGGMVWCSGHKLASAVSLAGGLGLIGSGSMRPELLLQHILQCRQSVNGRPFGVNIPLFYKYSQEFLEICIREKVPVVVTSAGSPRKATSALKAAGIQVGHVVPSAALALKCEAAGVDFVVGEGFEAGGHNGSDETTTFCLIPKIREAVSIPVVAAGGVTLGNHVLAAQTLGANGVQIGTRFACTLESSAHANFKKAILEAKEGTTRLMLKKLTPVRLARNAFFEQIVQLEQAGEDSPENLRSLLGQGRARRGIFEGDLLEGELEFGQGSSLIQSCDSVAGVFEALQQEYHQALQNLVQGV